MAGTGVDYSGSFERWRRLLHWGPLIAIGLVFYITSFAIYCDLMYWPPTSSVGGCLNLITFLTWVFLILYHHYRASAIGPGFVPLGWKPDAQKARSCLQWCEVCNGYKAPRSHHCRKCQRCVMKMDHHCPWINTCCGHFNHANFTYFLFFAPIGCMHAFIMLVMSLYYGINYRWYVLYGTGDEPMVVFQLWSLLGTLFAAGLAIGVTVAVGMLFFVQMSTILKNETGIENWIRKKAQYRSSEEDSDDDGDDATGNKGEHKPFVYPYDLGWWTNVRLVFRLPSESFSSDGIFWPVQAGCNQYTMTVEQLRQKKKKRERSVTCLAVEPYSGSLLPISKGVCICCCVPWVDGSRLSLAVGDSVAVTRWRKHWLYGERLPSTSGDSGFAHEKGWFPRRCVVEPTKKKGS